MKDKKYIIAGIIGIIVVALAVNLFNANKDQGKQTVSYDDPTDIVLDFYEEWLDAVYATDTDPYLSKLADNTPVLSKTLRDRLTTAPEDQGIDPVLCQSIPPEKISSKVIFTDASSTQILVVSKEPKQANQAVFTLSSLEDGWYIEDIVCSKEVSDAPYGINFEHEGGLFKGIESLSDRDYWSLMYAQDAQMVTAKLVFTANSTCIDTAGNESTCNPEQFTEAKVTVRGEVKEEGIEVTQLTFVQ